MIVESPAKARTISKFLGSGYTVEASIGHVRDLPQGAKQIPAEYKGEPWSNLGVNVNDDFTPIYIVPPGKTQADQAAEGPAQRRPTPCIWRRTRTARARPSVGTCWRCSSRRCRSTGWCSTKSPRRRSTRRSQSPRDVDDGLVRAQETRRILDRLYGYEVSPLLWRKVRPKLSAGRVQSVAVRLIVERERERMAFVSATWWDLHRQVRQDERPAASRPTLVSVDGRRIPAGKDFDPATGKLKNTELMLLDGAAAAALAERLRSGQFRVDERRRQAVHHRSPTRRSPPARCSRKPTASWASPPGGRCRSPKACTRTATSLTCVPTRPTWPRWRSTTPAELVADAIRRRVSAGRAARLSNESQERPGSPRRRFARPAIRSSCPRRCAAQLERRRVQALRHDLEADHRQPDGRRPRPADHDHDRRRRLRVPGQRQDDRLPRLPAGVRRRQRRSGGRAGRPGNRAAERRGGRVARVPST